MKRLLGYSLLLLNTVIAHSEEGVYLSANVGVAIPMTSDLKLNGVTQATIDASSGVALGGAVGYGFSNNVRIEAEVNYQQNELTSVSDLTGNSAPINGIDAYSISLLANGYYDFKNDSDFTPYLTAGLGFADVWTEFAGGGTSVSNFVFAYQAGGGLDYSVTEKFTIGVKYRYFGTTDIEDASVGGSLSYASNNVYATMRYSF